MARIIAAAIDEPVKAVIEAAIGRAYLHHLDGTDAAFRPGLGAGIFQTYQKFSVQRLHAARRIRAADAGRKKPVTLSALLAAIDPDTVFAQWQAARPNADPRKSQREFRLGEMAFAIRRLGSASYLVVTFVAWKGKPHPISAVPSRAEVSALQLVGLLKAWIAGDRLMLREKAFWEILRGDTRSS